MSAGMVSVPAIVPLKMPGFGATGLRKWSIDTKTPIQMHSSTKGCLIFYTLDGTKPDPFKRLGDKTTYQYTKTIFLRPGKRTLKAIAVYKDGSKESSVNTKVFQVAEAFIEEEVSEKSTMNTTWQNQPSDSEDEEKMDERLFKKVMRSSNEKVPSKKRDPIRKILTDESIDHDDSFDRHGLSEIEYLSCPYCDEPRPADPFARFCTNCNSILPPAPGRIRDSQYSAAFQDSLRKSMNAKHKIECNNCGTKNPSEAIQCMVCDIRLLNGVPMSKLSKDKAAEPSSNFIICPYCTRVNCGNARFCDWCGEKSNTKSRVVCCQRCSAQNLVSSQYCCSCGKNLPAPPRETLEKILDQGDLKIKDEISKAYDVHLGLLQSLTEEDTKGTWKNIEFDSVTRKQSKNVALQVGESAIASSINKLSLKEPKNSPGKGFWRQQVDFVAQHFKVYTQNNPVFQEQFSNQTLSTLISADLQESESKNGVKDLILCFTAPDDNTKTKKLKKKSSKTINSGETLINALKNTSRPPLGRSRPSSARSVTNQSAVDTIDSARSIVSSSRPSSGRKQKASKKIFEKEKLEAFYAKLSDDTRKLLELLKSAKEPDVDQIDSLLDSDDIDINVIDENGMPLLKLAIQNKHFDVIQSLIIGGVDIDAVSGPKGTTALHDAVAMGITGKHAIEILLDNDASFSIKDKRGKSAHDLAVDSGSDVILSVINQHTSKGLLHDVMKL